MKFLKENGIINTTKLQECFKMSGNIYIYFYRILAEFVAAVQQECDVYKFLFLFREHENIFYSSRSEM